MSSFARTDTSILSRALAKWILNFSFQEKIPVIGFSAAYTEAGALVSLHSTPENIGLQAAEILSEWATHGVFPPRAGIYPRYFKISVNPTVARAMGLDINRLRAPELEQQVQLMEESDD